MKALNRAQFICQVGSTVELAVSGVVTIGLSEDKEEHRLLFNSKELENELSMKMSKLEPKWTIQGSYYFIRLPMQCDRRLPLKLFINQNQN